MPDMLGDSLLPDSVQSRRRSVRRRLQNLRDPVRSTRERVVPGPDVVGRAETSFSDIRRKVVSADGLVDRIKERREGGSDEGEDSGSSGEATKSTETRTVN
jgi:hypothetical protein